MSTDHRLVNAHGLPMQTEITAGQTSDHRGVDLIMVDALPRFGVLLANRGCGADRTRATV